MLRLFCCIFEDKGKVRPHIFFGDPDSDPFLSTANMNGHSGQEKGHEVHTEIDVDELNEDGSTKTLLASNRAHIPSTQQLAIDFDGLSWPSK